MSIESPEAWCAAKTSRLKLAHDGSSISIPAEVWRLRPKISGRPLMCFIAASFMLWYLARVRDLPEPLRSKELTLLRNQEAWARAVLQVRRPYRSPWTSFSLGIHSDVGKRNSSTMSGLRVMILPLRTHIGPRFRLMCVVVVACPSLFTDVVSGTFGYPRDVCQTTPPRMSRHSTSAIDLLTGLSLTCT